MILPGAAIVFVIFAYAIINMLFSGVDSEPATTTSSSISTSNDESLFQNDGQGNVFRSIINVGLFLVGAGSILLGPVTFIVGLVMLITRLNQRSATQTDTTST